MYLSNLPNDISQKSLTAALSKYGKVTRISIPNNKVPEHTYKFAFVDFTDHSEAQNAINNAEFIGHDLGSSIKITWNKKSITVKAKLATDGDASMCSTKSCSTKSDKSNTNGRRCIDPGCGYINNESSERCEHCGIEFPRFEQSQTRVRPTSALEQSISRNASLKQLFRSLDVSPIRSPSSHKVVDKISQKEEEVNFLKQEVERLSRVVEELQTSMTAKTPSLDQELAKVVRLKVELQQMRDVAMTRTTTTIPSNQDQNKLRELLTKAKCILCHEKTAQLSQLSVQVGEAYNLYDYCRSVIKPDDSSFSKVLDGSAEALLLKFKVLLTNDTIKDVFWLKEEISEVRKRLAPDHVRVIKVQEEDTENVLKEVTEVMPMLDGVTETSTSQLDATTTKQKNAFSNLHGALTCVASVMTFEDLGHRIVPSLPNLLAMTKEVGKNLEEEKCELYRQTCGYVAKDYLTNKVALKVVSLLEDIETLLAIRVNKYGVNHDLATEISEKHHLKLDVEIPKEVAKFLVEKKQIEDEDNNPKVLGEMSHVFF